MLIDTHLHLDSSEFDLDREQVIARSIEKGVKYQVNSGSDAASSSYSVLLAQRHGSIFASIGIHPHNAFQIEEQIYSSLKSLASKNKVVAIGEIGLDYHYNFSLPEMQRKVFRYQINFARELKLPIIVHNRKADEDILKILKEEKACEVGGIIHCFSGGIPLAEKYIELGFFIGITGIITFKNAGELAEVVKEIPLENIVLETDSPYLAPYPFRGRRNEPFFLGYIAEKIAEVKELSLEEVSHQTSLNAINLFKFEKLKERI